MNNDEVKFIFLYLYRYHEQRESLTILRDIPVSYHRTRVILQACKYAGA